MASAADVAAEFVAEGFPASPTLVSELSVLFPGTLVDIGGDVDDVGELLVVEVASVDRIASPDINLFSKM